MPQITLCATGRIACWAELRRNGLKLILSANGHSGGGIHVEIERRRLMLAQQRRGARRAPRAVEGRFYGGGFAWSRHMHAQTPGITKNRQGERKSARRDLYESRKTAIVHLLSATGVVDRHPLDQHRIVEISHGRIFECEVPVLADTQADQINRSLLQPCRVVGADFLPIGPLAGDRIKLCNRDARQQMLPKIGAETPGIGRGESGQRVVGAESPRNGTQLLYARCAAVR